MVRISSVLQFDQRQMIVTCKYMGIVNGLISKCLVVSFPTLHKVTSFHIYSVYLFEQPQVREGQLKTLSFSLPDCTTSLTPQVVQNGMSVLKFMSLPDLGLQRYGVFWKNGSLFKGRHTVSQTWQTRSLKMFIMLLPHTKEANKVKDCGLLMMIVKIWVACFLAQIFPGLLKCVI